MSNERRFESIAVLEDDFVLAVPENAKPEDVLDEVISTSRSEIWNYMHHVMALIATAAELKKHPTDKPSDFRARYRSVMDRHLARKSAKMSIRTTNFQKRYADIIVSSKKDERVVLIDVKDIGIAQVSADYIYQKVMIRLGGDEKRIMFQPSKHLRDPSKIWALKQLTGEKLLLKELDANSWSISGAFIEQVMTKVKLPFYLSKDKDQMFAAPLEIHKLEHGPLKKISAKQALKYLSVPALERVLEQGSAKL